MDEELQTTEQVAEEVSASLNAGFAKVRGEEPPAADTPAVVEPVTEEPQETRQPTEIELLQSKFDAEIRKMHGKYGEVVGELKQLKAQPNPVEDAAPIPEWKAVASLTAQEFPELGDTISRDLTNILAQRFPNASPEKITELVKEQASQATAGLREEFQQEAAKLRVEAKHPDWEEAVVSPEYKAWFASKPAEFQQEFGNTWDARLVVQGLNEFKTWRDTTQNARQHKQARLEGAITPTGVPAAHSSKLPDSAGLNAGFSRVRQHK